MVTDKRFEALAYHEAGHAVVACHFGRQVGPVRIDAGTVTGTAQVGEGFTPDHQALDRIKLMIYLAGGRAERIFDPCADTRMPSHDDESRVAQIIDEHLRAKHGRYADVEIEADTINGDLAKQTDELVRTPKIWKAIQALAAALLDKHRLDGSEAEQIIQEAFNIG